MTGIHGSWNRPEFLNFRFSPMTSESPILVHRHPYRINLEIKSNIRLLKGDNVKRIKLSLFQHTAPGLLEPVTCTNESKYSSGLSSKFLMWNYKIQWSKNGRESLESVSWKIISWKMMLIRDAKYHTHCDKIATEQTDNSDGLFAVRKTKKSLNVWGCSSFSLLCNSMEWANGKDGNDACDNLIH